MNAPTSELRYTVAMQHKDICASCVDGQGCALKMQPEQWQTVAAFLWLSETLEYAKNCATAGHLRARAFSHLSDPPQGWEYTPDGKVTDVPKEAKTA